MRPGGDGRMLAASRLGTFLQRLPVRVASVVARCIPVAARRSPAIQNETFACIGVFARFSANYHKFVSALFSRCFSAILKDMKRTSHNLPNSIIHFMDYNRKLIHDFLTRVNGTWHDIGTFIVTKGAGIISSVRSYGMAVPAKIQRVRNAISQTASTCCRDSDIRVLTSVVLVLLAALLLNCFQNTSWINFLQTILLSYIAGGFFWILCVWFPSIEKRQIEKAWLKERYLLTKRRLISRLFESINIWLNAQEIENLLHPTKFRNFLKQRENSGIDIFGAAETSWDCNPIELNDVKFHLMQLVAGIESTLEKIGPRNRVAYERLAFFCYRTREVFSVAVYSGDLAKYVGEELVYPRLAAWHYNPSPAQIDAFSRGRDLMEEDIENL